MSETVISEGITIDPEKPVASEDDVEFPPFPEVCDDDFEDDITDEERTYYKTLYKDLNIVKTARLHCTACDRHLGSSTRNEGRMRAHPMLRTLVCHSCHTFYNSGEFEKGDDGSELYCRWCGQGGQVYCCSDCPHVFCAKCIKRNLGTMKIKEIENTDDWKCFKCNSRCLWDLRAMCWALLRYCDVRNKCIHQTQDPVKRELFIKSSAIDDTTCCKYKKRKEKEKEKKKEKDTENSKSPAVVKEGTIKVKKFAHVNNDDGQKKKAQKRPASPKFLPIILHSPNSSSSPVIPSPPMKKYKGQTSTVMNPLTIEKKQRNLPRILPLPANVRKNYNGYNNVPMMHNMAFNDTLNLSLESLTQGLDMSQMASISSLGNNDNVVCTPDFPLEPLCEVTEDNDDDVECITPTPTGPRPIGPAPPLIPRPGFPDSMIKLAPPPPLVTIDRSKLDMSFDNIVQMSEKDVTINQVTGGLKFRVDPQTLSSNKMYRLPDGRIFAINVNPTMPGGYSATIVAVSDAGNKVTNLKGTTYAAKLGAVSVAQTPPASSPKPRRALRTNVAAQKKKVTKPTSKSPADKRTTDFKVPVEWYRYNLLDAIDCLEYSLVRLNKLKKDATTNHLRTRTLNEMRGFHRHLERLLITSSQRFNEIRENINKELKQYIIQKKRATTANHCTEVDCEDDDDDDVEILPDENDGPICIDENSSDSIPNGQEEVDLTGVGDSSGTKDSSNRDNDLDFMDKNLTNPDNTFVCNESFSGVLDKMGSNISDARMIGSANDDDKLNDNNKEKLDDNIEYDSKQITDDNIETHTKKEADDNVVEEIDPDKEKVKEDKIEIVSDKEKESDDCEMKDTDSNEEDKDLIHNDKDKSDVSMDKESEESNNYLNKTKDEPAETDLTKDVEDIVAKVILFEDNMVNEKTDLVENMPEPEISDELIESLLKDDSMEASNAATASSSKD